MHVAPELALFHISDVSAAGEVRRSATALADLLGFDETAKGSVAIVAAEAVKNVAIHARHGEVHLRPLERNGVKGIELLAIDRGPGMEDIARYMRDGYSTSGTAGIGLGAIARLSSEFDIFSDRPGGTVLLSRIWATAVTRMTSEPPSLQWGFIQAPKTGESVCGDAVAIEADGQHATIMVADGLGHGPMAHEAATEATRIFRANRGAALMRLMELIHAGLKPTRGAAVSIARCDWGTGQMDFSGVGNVAAMTVTSGASRSMAPHNGTMGHAFRKMTPFNYPLGKDSLLLMHSDGLGTHWKLETYAGLAQRHPGVIAGVLYRDYNRGRDDVTVVAMRPAANGGR
jgi:anti-sigma regulatory factor (Ser/Thr protein kinase)